jgi:Mrp family chromosome partitioning ATPase
VTPVADALVLAQAANTTLLVVAARRTPAATLRQAVDLLRQSGTCVIGAVLNQPQRRPATPAPHEQPVRTQPTEPAGTLIAPAVLRPGLESGIDGQPVHHGVTGVRPRRG